MSVVTSNAASIATRATVWLVDDSPLERELTRRTLALDYEVEAFENGDTVLERVAIGSRPDVLVLDWHMPTISGREICIFLRSSHDAASLPILILTASSTKQDLLEGLAAGANDFVSKQADQAELCARVATLIQVKCLHDALRRSEGLAQRARDEAAHANEAKDLFLGIVSHELRTPLNSILGWARLLVDDPVDEKTKRLGLETIQRNARLQVRLIEDILDTTRIISGKLHLDPKVIDLGIVARAAVEGIRLGADAKHQHIDVRVDRNPHRVWGDAERLQQAVGNLLANAIKFTPPGGSICVALRESAEAGASADAGNWELEVTDSGKGIDAELLPSLFERFRQQDGSASKRYSGLGLGLSLVRYIAEAHGGSVSASSAGEKLGATFVLRLPREADGQPRKRESTVPVFESRSVSLLAAISELDILVVEDDEDARGLLVTVLTRAGARVREAASSEAALALIEKVVPDVLVSDIGLPDLDGYELIREVRSRGYSAKRLPAIALTAYARAEDRKFALDAGFQAYVAKPVELDNLIAIIVRMVTARAS